MDFRVTKPSMMGFQAPRVPTPIPPPGSASASLLPQPASVNTSDLLSAFLQSDRFPPAAPHCALPDLPAAPGVQPPAGSGSSGVAAKGVSCMLVFTALGGNGTGRNSQLVA